MEANELNGLLAGGMFLTSGLAGLSRHFLLEPTLPPPHQTSHPRWLLNVFFVFSAIMIYVGLRYIVDATGSHTSNYTGLSVLIAGAICGYKLSLLTDTIQRKPSFTLDDILKGLNNIKDR